MPRLRRALLGDPRLSPLERNARYLVIEIAFAAALNVIITLNAAYAIRLGASNGEVGLLSAAPALLAVLVTIPVGKVLTGRRRLMPSMLKALLIYRLGYLAAALLPFMPGAAQGTLFVWLIAALAIPLNIVGVAWNSMFADIVPERSRPRVLSLRLMTMSAVGTAVAYLGALWLDRAPFPYNYQALYFVAFLSAMGSQITLNRLYVPDAPIPVSGVAGAGDAPAVQRSSRLSRLLGELRGHADFVRIVINTFAYSAGLWMAMPLYMLYFVRDLQASDGWVGLNTTMTSLSPILGYYLARRAIDAWGENRVLKWTIGGVGVYTLLVGLTRDLNLMLLWTALNGLGAAAVNISHFAMLLKVCPQERRPLYIGAYTSAMNVGAFALPLIGVAVSDRLGLAPTLLVAGAACVAGSMLFRIFPLRTPDSSAVGAALAGK